MKVALLEYYMSSGELLGDSIKSKKNKILFNRITKAARANVELSKELLGQLRFEFDLSCSDSPNSTFIEPCYFNFPIKHNQYSVLKTRNLTLDFCLKFPVIVPDYFETEEELNEYIYEYGIVHSCYISSDIFKNEEWNIDLDEGYDIYALKLSKRIYNEIPRSVRDFYSNSEIRFEYDL